MPTENLQGVPAGPFFDHISQSNRIREHAGNLSSGARKVLGFFFFIFG